MGTEAMSDFPGGKITIGHRMDGAIRIECRPQVVVVSPDNAVKIAQALLKEAGVDIVLAEPGQTVIRPPRRIAS
jgi:hypothetical protein